jgi:hypothetical protein
MSEYVYEIRDATDDESYHSVGVFTTIDEAIRHCTELDGETPLHGDFTDPDYYDSVTLEVYRWPLNAVAMYAKRVYCVQWEWKWSDDEESQVWFISKQGEVNGD